MLGNTKESAEKKIVQTKDLTNEKQRSKNVFFKEKIANQVKDIIIIPKKT